MIDQEAFSEHPVSHTHEPDEVRDGVARILAEHRLDLHGRRNQFDARFNAFRLGNVTASYLRYGSEVSLIVDPPQGYHLNFPLTGVVETVFPAGSVAATPYRGCFYLPGVAHTQRWSDGSAQICLKFATDALERELQHILGRPYKGRIRFKPLMDLTAPESQGFLDALNLYERECARPTGIARQPLAAKHLEHLLMDTLLLAQPHNFSEALNAPPRAAAPKAVRQAIDVIEGHPETPLTVTDLARAAGVSVRSLQAGFQRHLETSPMAYLRDVRLGRVHEDLLSAPAGSTTVTDVAYKWGFVHVGRFTKEYRRKFGQLPSRTMRTTSV